MRARPRDEEETAVFPEPTAPAPEAEVAPPGADGAAGRRGPAVALAPALAVLLVLLVAAGGFLWLTRPGESAVSTGDYAEALQAARSGVVDYTSFDYLTLDDDIEQIRRISVGDLRDQGVARLDERRAEITEAEAVSSTEIVDAGVVRADGQDATVLLVIQSTQESTASPQAQVVRYRIEVGLEKDGDRWLLSGIKGTEGPGVD
jgi:Mce-associated membrane protein